MVLVAGAVLAVVGVRLAWAAVERPQRVLLVLAALAPFDGLLVLFEGPGLLRGWKEALVLVAVVASFLAPARARADAPAPVPRWVTPLAGIAALAVVSALWAPLPYALAGLKIELFYLLVPLVLWRCPFTAADRDRLVTILMTVGVITATVGVGQQLLGEARLHQLGYDYNTHIRSTGGVLRSFSTFELPFPFAFFMALVLVVCVPVALADTSRHRNRLFLALAPLLAVGMFASLVRAALLAVAASLLYLVSRHYRLPTFVVPAVVVALAVAVVAAPTQIGHAVISSSSLLERTEGWSTVANSIVANPIGTGVGTTGAAAQVAVDRGAEISHTFDLPAAQWPYQPDNYYMKRVIELGLIGLWLTLGLLRQVVESAQSVRRRLCGADAALVDGIAASVIGAAAAALVATYWEIFPLDLYFWMMLGVLTSIERNGSSSAGSPSEAAAVASKPTFANC